MPVTESTYFCRHGIDRSKFGCPKCMCPHRVDTNFRVCNSCIPPAVPVLAPTPDPRLLSDEQLAWVDEQAAKREMTRSDFFRFLIDKARQPAAPIVMNATPPERTGSRSFRGSFFKEGKK